MTTEQAIEKYKQAFGAPNESLGFNLTAKKRNGAILVEMWYSRNEWHCEIEDQAWFYNNGSVTRNKQVIKNIDEYIKNK